MVAVETDTIPRVNLSDLFLTLRTFEKESSVSLDDIRLRFCVDRKKKLSGDLHWATATHNATELQRLALIEGSPFPKDRRSYEQVRSQKIRLTKPGQTLLDTFREERARGYDDLFRAMYAAHPYLRAFVRAIGRGVLVAPVVTSLRQHVSEKYSSAVALAEDVARRMFDIDGLCKLLEKRMRRSLSSQEVASIQFGISGLLDEAASSAVGDEATEFSKKFLLKINDVILPAILKNDELAFDYRTHRTIWSFGQDWKLWQATSSHPDFDCHLIYATARIDLAASDDRIGLSYNRGLAAMRENFLAKVYEAYQRLQRSGRGTYVLAWELRAVFSYEHRCQESVFDRLMEEHYLGSDEFELQLDIQRQKSQHDRPLRVGNRNIGVVRVIRKGVTA